MRIVNRTQLHDEFPNQPELLDKTNKLFFIDAVYGVVVFKDKEQLRTFLLCRNVTLTHVKGDDNEI